MKKDLKSSVPVDREYLDKTLNEFTVKIFNYMQDFRQEVKSEIERVDNRLDTIQNSMDYLVGEYRKLSDEQTAEVSSHDRFEEKLDDHETRIGQLENLEFGQEAV